MKVKFILHIWVSHAWRYFLSLKCLDLCCEKENRYIEEKGGNEGRCEWFFIPGIRNDFSSISLISFHGLVVLLCWPMQIVCNHKFTTNKDFICQPEPPIACTADLFAALKENSLFPYQQNQTGFLLFLNIAYKTVKVIHSSSLILWVGIKET